MPDITLKDFRGGLDTRKYVLSQPAGVLAVATNAHINQGAEVEKRKAFTKIANSSGAVSTSLPANTFGWQATADGHLVFGSVDGSALTFPSGVTYQRLRHPQALASYGDVSMTQLVFSEIYGGKAFAIAKFGSSGTFAYYDGTLISDFTAGIILAYLNTDAKIATFLTSLINATDDYTATQQGSTAKLDVFGLPGNLYTTAITENAAGGSISAQLLNNGLATVAGQQAVGQFQIVTGTQSAGVNYISSVKVNNVELLKNSTAINYTTDEATTASLIATSISSAAGTHGYYAVASGPMVSILPLVAGTSTNGYQVKVTAAGNVCIGYCVFSIGGDSTVGMTSITSSTVLKTTTHRARNASNVATLTIGTHPFIVGDIVTIAGVTGAAYNGSKTITAITATTISYASTGSSEATTADTGGTVVYTTGSNIMGGAVAGTSNGLSSLASSIAAAIRTNSGSSGFLANAIGAKIYISRVVTSSDDPALSLVVTTAGAGLTVAVGATAATQVGLTAYLLNITGTLKTSRVGPYTIHYQLQPATIGSVSVILGGTLNPPYTYLWTKVTGDTTYPNLISVVSTTASPCTFNLAGYSNVQLGYTIRETWKCTVTDASGVALATAPTIDILVAIPSN